MSHHSKAHIELSKTDRKLAVLIDPDKHAEGDLIEDCGWRSRVHRVTFGAGERLHRLHIEVQGGSYARDGDALSSCRLRICLVIISDGIIPEPGRVGQRTRHLARWSSRGFVEQPEFNCRLHAKRECGSGNFDHR